MKNMIAWVEIPATKMESTVKFYEGLLGLELKILDFGQEKMACFPNDEGAISQSPGFDPGDKGVLVSLQMGDDLDRALEYIADHGGEVVKAKTKIQAEGRGYFAIFVDPEGNKLGLYGNS